MATPLERDPNTSRPGAGAAGLTLVLGLWYIVSAWVYGPASSSAAAMWNSVIVGILIAIFAAVRLSARSPTSTARWIDLMLGIWAFFSPWIYGFVPNEARFINSLCVGVIVFALSISNSGSRPTVVHMR
jgi:SPW repeat